MPLAASAAPIQESVLPKSIGSRKTRHLFVFRAIEMTTKCAKF